ncbi:MAG: sigma 54-interacting transcriptional regulator [Desulfosudis oleivorans]|nr:sigma 54-interacting transcriptional regulator [Desulfosudis oleivorans]
MRKAEGFPISISTALLRDKDGKLLGAVETFRDISVEEDLRKAIQAKYSFADIISKNHKMLQLFDILPDIADSASTVLIEGESGTGKELVARAIHNLSARKKQPFIAVNCSALPDTLLESELFGYKAGAFTDAKKDKPGRFRLAENGTLFLDEIGDITPAMQVKLLRVLQEKTYEPLGATQSVEHNVRIIAATNKNLEELVRQGRFREDLFYRINVFKISLPPLRERMEDIPLADRAFYWPLQHAAKKEYRRASATKRCPF